MQSLSFGNGEGESIFDPFRIPPFKEKERREREMGQLVGGWAARFADAARKRTTATPQWFGELMQQMF